MDKSINYHNKGKQAGVVISAVILILFILFVSSSCTTMLAFDKELEGNYELFNTEDGPEYLVIDHNGRFSDSKGSGWIEIPRIDTLHFVYDDETVKEVQYKKNNKSLTIINQDDLRIEYIDTSYHQNFHNSGIKRGRYIDTQTLILFTFKDNGVGTMVSLEDSSETPFKYIAHNGILRLEYDDHFFVGYEYLTYKDEGQTLTLKFPNRDSRTTLLPEDKRNFNGQYKLLYYKGINSDFMIDRISFSNHFCILNDSKYNVIRFPDNTILLEKDGQYIPIEFTKNSSSHLSLDYGGLSLEFIDELTFSKDFDQWVGIYVSEDLAYLLQINEDGSGNLTIDDKGIDFSSTISNNILRCQDEFTGYVFYLEMRLEDDGIYLAEMPRAKSDTSCLEYLIKIR